MFSSLRAKLAFSHLGVIFITASILAFITYVAGIQIHKKDTLTTLHKNSLINSIIISNYLSNKQNILKKVSESRRTTLPSQNFKESALANYFESFTDEFASMSYFTPTGMEEVRLEYGLPIESLRDCSKDIEVQEAIQNPGKVVLSIFTLKNSTTPTSILFTLAEQSSLDDKISHILQASIPISMLEEHLENIHPSDSDSIVVLDHTGMVLIHPDQNYLLTKTKLPTARQGIVEIDQMGFKGIYNRTDMTSPNWQVFSIKPFNQYMAAPIRYAIMVFAVFCCVLLMGILLVNFIARKINAPIIALTRAVTMLSSGKKIELIPPYNIEELDNLVEAFNTLSFDLTETTISKEYLDNILNSLRECLIVTSLSGTIESANQMTFDLIGCTEEQLIGQPISCLFPEKFDIDTYLIGVRDEKERETFFVTRDKQQVPIIFYRAYLKGKHGDDHGIVCLAQDIRKKKKVEEEKERLKVQLQKAQRLETVGTLASGIAHDFNNILTIIIGYSQILNFTIKDEESKKSLDQILAASSRAQKLVQQLMEFSRQGAQSKMEISLVPIVKEIVKMLKSSIPASIDIYQEFSQNCGTIMADPSQLQQIIMNICNNAIHAMGEYGTLTIKLADERVTESNMGDYQAVPLDNYIKLMICDTGHGIKAENLERIFDPFFTTKDVDKGTGLGLAVVHGMMQNMDGHIFVTSKEDVGTTFTLLFPALDQKEEHGKNPSGTALNSVLPGKGEHILFVDDEKALATLGKRNLEHLGYRVTCSTSSEEALKLFQETPNSFDMLITDFSMPKMQGDRLIEEIKKIREGIPVILCTGYHAKLVKTRGIGGGNRTIEKPYTSERLAAEIYDLLKLKKDGA